MSLVKCIVPVASIRAEPSHRSEQVSQILFGEEAEVEETDKEFAKVRLKYDGYDGWCQISQLGNSNDSGSEGRPLLLAGDWINTIEYKGEQMIVPMGSDLSAVEVSKIHGKVFSPKENHVSKELINEISSLFLNTSYLWGGRSVFGIDCSGFTQMVYKFLNIPLRRDASQQAFQGSDLGFLEEAQCGDLAFFDNDEGKITHVGIILSTGSIIHASGKVRIDRIDSMGIISNSTGKRTHKLRVIKRVI